MRTPINQRCRFPFAEFQAIEPLENRTHLDGVASSMPPVPVVDQTRPIDAATLHALGDHLHTLAGDGTSDSATATPWIDQWFPAEADAPASGLPSALSAGGLDLSALDDGSGDGLTDDDIYSFNLPETPALPDAPASQAIMTSTTELHWISNSNDTGTDELSPALQSGPRRSFLA